MSGTADDERDTRWTGVPPSVEPNAAVLVVALGRRVRDDAERRLRSGGLSMRHVSALGHLAADPGCSYSELARRAGITAQSMQATLAQLERLGAVERRTEAGRGRRAQLHVTTTGAELSAWAKSVLAGLNDDLLARVPPDDRAGLTRALLLALRERAGDAAEPAT